MAATCTVSKKVVVENGITYFTVIEWTWVSHTDGTVANVGAIANISGRVESVKYIPDAGGTQPTDLYDVTILDANGLDVLGGSGANKSNAKTTASNDTTPFNSSGGYVHLWNATLTPSITNAGSGKGGVIRMILR